MRSINIRKFIDCPADVFELQGRCLPEDEGCVPCRIRVGYRRILKEYVCPERLKLTLWRESEGQVTYSPDISVRAEVDGDGVIHVDAVSLVESCFGKVHPDDFCCSACWRGDKENPCSDTFLTTPRGIAQCGNLLTADDWSMLYLAPGTLTVGDHDIYSIGWLCAGGKCGACREEMKPLIDRIFSGAHAVSVEELRQIAAANEFIQDCEITQLRVRTNRGYYELCIFGDYIRVKLNGESDMVDGFQLCRNCSILDQIGILLQLLQAEGSREIREQLKDFMRQGLVRSF